MPISMDNILVLVIMLFYGLLSGGSAIILKIGIFRAGGIKIDNFLHDIGPAVWKLIKTPIWLIGAIAAITGFIIYTLALNIYDVSVVKPLVNSNLFFTFVFAYIIFKEHLSRIEWFGVSVLLTGLLLSAFSFEIESLNLMNTPLLLTFFPITIFMMVIMVFIMFISKKGHAELIFPIFAGFFYGMGTFFTKSALISLNILENSNFLPIGLLLYSVFMFLLTYGFAIIAQQLAFERGRLSIVSPITNSLSVIVSFIGAYFVFYEDLILPIEGELVFQSFFKVLGLICFLIALFILCREITIPISDKSETASLIS
ncbi:MAG: hypothetical protein ACFE9L_05895 [Candidatus Hodarchaeota archaeon]